MDFGVHVSITGGIDKAVGRAVMLGLDTFQIFTRSSRSWKYKSLKPEIIQRFKEAIKKHHYRTVVVHMPYLPNLASSEEEIYKKSVDSLVTEVKRCDILTIPYLVLHLGSHKGKGLQQGLKQIVNALEKALELNPKVTLLLETAAGTKNSIGSTFEELAQIMEKISDPDKCQICFDTCHVFAAGYDLRTTPAVERTIEQFENCLGLKNLAIIHANDSKGRLGSGKDRHEHIGMGFIGEKGFKALLQQISSRPVILETPIDDRCDDVGNLAKIKSLAV